MENEIQPTSQQEKTLDQLEAEINAMAGPQTQQAVIEPQPAQTETTPEQTPAEKVVQQGVLEQNPSDVAQTAPPTQVETDKPVKTTFEELQRQTGIKDPDALASSYREAVKKITQQGQELSQLRRVAQPEYQQPVPQQEMTSDPFEDAFQREVARVGYARAIMGLASAINQPLVVSQKENELKTTIARLSANPATADFNTPEIQSEIGKILQAEPQKYVDPQTNNVKAEEIIPLYERARGRVLRNPAIKAQSGQQAPVVVEGRAKFTPPQGQVDINKMSLDELEAYINSKKS